MLPAYALGSSDTLASLDNEALAQLIEELQNEQKKREEEGVIVRFANSAEHRAHQYEGPGWDTPEEAVLVYMEGLKTLDLDKMLSAFAIETYVDYFDLQARIEWLQAYMFSYEVRLPSSNKLFAALNIESRKTSIVNSIFFQVATILFPDFEFLITNAVQDYEGGSDEIFSMLNTPNLVLIETLEIGEFIPPFSLSDVYLSERNQTNIQRIQATLGGSELKSLVLRFYTEDKNYLLCCDVVRYGEKWFMSSFPGNIGNLYLVSAAEGGLATD